MRPLVLLAASSLLGPSALVVASDYPPPTGPYRTPETLESLAAHARAILDILGSASPESGDRPDRHDPGPAITVTLNRTGASAEQFRPAGPGPALTSAATDTSVSPPARWEAWDQAGYAPPVPEPPALTQDRRASDSADPWMSPRIGEDSQPHYAQASIGEWRPEGDPYATADRYPESPLDTGYYGAAPAGQGYPDNASDPNWYYPTEAYREPLPVTGVYERRGSPDAWSYYPRDDQPASPLDSGYYPQQSRRGQPNQRPPEHGAYPLPPQITDSLPGSGAYPGMTQEAGSYYGVGAYPELYREADPYLGGQAAYAPAYPTAPAHPLPMPVPARKASYSQDNWRSGAGHPPQTLRIPEGASTSNYPEYHGGYLAPGGADPLAEPAYYAPASPSARFRETGPTSHKFYYGDYAFAPLPRSGRKPSQQRAPSRQRDAYGYIDGGIPQQAPGGFRNAGQLQSSVTGPGGQVYRYRPIKEKHSRAPHAQTWEPRDYPPPQDYRDQDWSYPDNRSRNYRDRR